MKYATSIRNLSHVVLLACVTVLSGCEGLLL